MAHNFVLQLCFAIVLVTNVVSGDALLINGSIDNHTYINHDATAPVDDTTQVNDTAPVDDATSFGYTTPVNDATPDPKLTAQLENFWRQEKRFGGFEIPGVELDIPGLDDVMGVSEAIGDPEEALSIISRFWKGSEALIKAFKAFKELIKALIELKSLIDDNTPDPKASERRGIARRQVEGLGSLVARRDVEKRILPVLLVFKAAKLLTRAERKYEVIGGALEELGVNELSKETQKKKRKNINNYWQNTLTKKKNRQSKEQVQPDGVDSTPTEDVKANALPSWLLEGWEVLTTALNASEILGKALNELKSIKDKITEILDQEGRLKDILEQEEVDDATRDRRASAHLGEVQRRMEMFEESLEARKSLEKRSFATVLAKASEIGGPAAVKVLKSVLTYGPEVVEALMVVWEYYDMVGEALNALLSLKREDTQSQEQLEQYEYSYYDYSIITTTLVDSTTTRNLEASARKGEASTNFKIRPSVVLLLAALVVPVFFIHTRLL